MMSSFGLRDPTSEIQDRYYGWVKDPCGDPSRGSDHISMLGCRGDDRAAKEHHWRPVLNHLEDGSLNPDRMKADEAPPRLR